MNCKHKYVHLQDSGGHKRTECGYEFIQWDAKPNPQWTEAKKKEKILMRYFEGEELDYLLGEKPCLTKEEEEPIEMHMPCRLCYHIPFRSCTCECHKKPKAGYDKQITDPRLHIPADMHGKPKETEGAWVDPRPAKIGKLMLQNIMAYYPGFELKEMAEAKPETPEKCCCEEVSFDLMRTCDQCPTHGSSHPHTASEEKEFRKAILEELAQESCQPKIDGQKYRIEWTQRLMQRFL